MTLKDVSWPLWVAAFMAAGTACSESMPEAERILRTEVDTVGGVLHVRSWGDAPQWRIERVLRIGTLEGGPEEFGRIRSLVADADRNIYIADNPAHEIRVFSPNGSLLRTIGRRGEGPGEFEDLYSLAWLGESLVAMDPANARITTFSREGDWLESLQHYAITGSATLIRLYPLV